MLFPTSQTGLQVHGVYHWEPIQLGYHLTLSNGRGPIDTYQDFDDNKAIGGRLFSRADSGAGTLTLGASGYKGTYTERTEVVVVNADGSFGFERPRTLQYDELALAADLKWDWEGLAVQAEAIVQDVVYDDLRPEAFAFDGGPPGLVADTRRWGAYVQVGYRFEFGGIMPYAGYEYYVAPGFFGTSYEAWGGLNVRPTPRVVLKVQYDHAWLPDFSPDEDYRALNFQAAWSF
jgi:hypothetical protein